jgi:tRNA pseudouridine38-40 synthase
MRYKLIVEYDGGPYCGLQRQGDIAQKSVGEVLENAIFCLSQEKIKITASGRTDAGVHAIGQVVHFDLKKEFQPHNIVLGLNNYMRSEDVSIIACEIVNENFHARFSATMRHYRYAIINRPAPLALQKNRAWHVGKKLDVEAMAEAAKFLLGSHDFSAFRDAECQARSPIKTIEKINVRRAEDELGAKILIEVSAKSFLHHMVRNIVGTLVWVGSGKISVEDIKKILASRDRKNSGPNAPACGLYFLGVEY